MDNIFELPPYSLDKIQKQKILVDELRKLTNFHYQNCKEYTSILDAFGYKNKQYKKIEDFFALPVLLFKEYQFKSTSNIVKTLTSSGTTSSKVSQIFLDKQTALLQTKALIKIMQNFIGKTRLPMLIIDTKSIVSNRYKFSARAAGILGLSNFGRKHTYILDDDMKLDVNKLKEFLEMYKDEKILIFGFTFMVWEYFYKQLVDLNIDIDLSNAMLFHSGGWKKLENMKVSNEIFKESFYNLTKLKNIHNFYGMVEQVGSIFVECEYGHLHTPNFADIVIRDAVSMEVLPYGQKGVIELISLIPHSYPGHVILSEDEGIILGEDDCKCGRCGKYFKVIGRLKQAEQRGCSDTFRT